MKSRFAKTIPVLILGTWLCSCDQGRSPSTGDFTDGNGTIGSHSSSSADTISDPVSTRIDSPGFSVPSGTAFSAFSVELLSFTAGSTVYYTTDGSIPTTSSARYSGPIRISTSCTVTAMVAKDGKRSPTSSADYRIVDLSRTARDPKVAGTWVTTDTETITSGSYSSTSTVTFLANGGATLDWTLTTYQGTARSTSSNHGEGSWYTDGSSLVTDVYNAGYGGDGVETLTYSLDGSDLVLNWRRYTRK